MRSRTGSIVCAALLWATWLAGCAAQQAPATNPFNLKQVVSTCTRNPVLDPLVTEWPASEKAHLQSVYASAPVAVHYDGCELRLVEDCKLGGGYSWRQAAAQSAQLQIDSKQELDEQLPIGGFRLEGELQRSGSLLLETTPAGVYELNSENLRAPDLGPCTEVTHVVSAVTVGSFRLLGRGREQQSSAVQAGVEVTGHSARSEELLRQAGLAERCAFNTELGPDIQCASPLRLKLVPLQQALPGTPEERARKAGEVLVQLQAEPTENSKWTLNDAAGKTACTLPCSFWLRPRSGHVVQRVGAAGAVEERVPIAGGFPVAPGERALGIVHPQRGMPQVSNIAFWAVGAPAIVFGGLVGVAGALEWLNSDEDYTTLRNGLIVAAAGGGIYVWYAWSREAYVEFNAAPRSAAAKPAAQGSVSVGPVFVRGQF